MTLNSSFAKELVNLLYKRDKAIKEIIDYLVLCDVLPDDLNCYEDECLKLIEIRADLSGYPLNVNEVWNNWKKIEKIYYDEIKPVATVNVLMRDVESVLLTYDISDIGKEKKKERL